MPGSEAALLHEEAGAPLLSWCSSIPEDLRQLTVRLVLGLEERRHPDETGVNLTVQPFFSSSFFVGQGSVMWCAHTGEGRAVLASWLYCLALNNLCISVS